MELWWSVSGQTGWLQLFHIYLHSMCLSAFLVRVQVANSNVVVGSVTCYHVTVVWSCNAALWVKVQDISLVIFSKGSVLLSNCERHHDITPSEAEQNWPPSVTFIHMMRCNNCAIFLPRNDSVKGADGATQFDKQESVLFKLQNGLAGEEITCIFQFFVCALLKLVECPFKLQSQYRLLHRGRPKQLQQLTSDL